MKKTLITLALGVGATSMAFAQTPAITNGGMETWVNVTAFGQITLERPTAWYGTDQVLNHTVGPLFMLQSLDFDANKQLFQDTAKYEGTKAARLMTKDFGDTLHVLPVMMTNAKQNLNLAGLLSGGTSGLDLLSLFKFTNMPAGYGKRIDSVTAYVKTPATNLDQSAGLVICYKKVTADSMIVVGQGGFNIEPNIGAGGYAKITIPVIYTGSEATDSFVVAFTSSGVASLAGFTVDNTLYVDKVDVYSSEPSGVAGIPQADLGFTVYPNPAVNEIYVNNKNSVKGARILIQNSLGKIMYSEVLTSGSNSVNLSQYAAGVYFYEIYNNNGTERQMGKFVK